MQIYYTELTVRLFSIPLNNISRPIPQRMESDMCMCLSTHYALYLIQMAELLSRYFPPYL